MLKLHLFFELIPQSASKAPTTPISYRGGTARCFIVYHYVSVYEDNGTCSIVTTLVWILPLPWVQGCTVS